MPGQPVYTREPIFGEVLNHGSKTVASAGTAEPLTSTRVNCLEVLIQVKPSNTGFIAIGGAAVPNDGSAGIILEAPTAGVTPPSLPISAQNLDQIYINPEVNGEGVNFIYW
jgi:hypothetical protein